MRSTHGEADDERAQRANHEHGELCSSQAPPRRHYRTLSQSGGAPMSWRRNELDRHSVAELATLMNDADASVPTAVRAALPAIVQAIEAIEDRLRRGGRMLYVGAGTSGRLGVLDASELPPT